MPRYPSPNNDTAKIEPITGLTPSVTTLRRHDGASHFLELKGFEYPFPTLPTNRVQIQSYILKKLMSRPNVGGDLMKGGKQNEIKQIRFEQPIKQT